MIKPKNLISCVGAGFLLSFFISVFSTHNFGRSLLRAVIFAAVFGVLYAGIAFIYGKFLSNGESESHGDISESLPRRTTGSRVDITVDGESLSDDGEGPEFFVDNNKRRLSSEDTVNLAEKKASMPIQDTGNDMENVPIAKASMGAESVASDNEQKIKEMAAENLAGASVEPSVSPVVAQPSPVVDNPGPVKAGTAKRDVHRSEAMQEIDQLPDIGGIAEAVADVDDSQVLNDTEFAESSSSSGDSSRVTFSDGSHAKDHDTATLAKAIQTLLKREE